MNNDGIKLKFVLGLMIFILNSFTLNSFAQQQTTESKAVNKVKQTSSGSSRLLGMSVTGNKESPRSLTIVPWRDPLMEGKSPEIIPVWQPNLNLLEPDAYRRDINLFLKSRTRRKTLQNAN